MSVEKHTDLQSLPVENPHPDCHAVHTPDSLVDIHSSVRRKLPTPHLLDPREVDEHVHRTIERLRTQRSFRRHLGGAKNIGSRVTMRPGFPGHVLFLGLCPGVRAAFQN